MKEYFVYEHWSTVHDVCFYVGLSHVPKADRVWKERTRYYRAYQNAKSGRRSKEWLEMAAMGLEVRIVFETTDFNIACDKEIELIAKYKRKKFDKDGTLVNIDFGGVHLKGPRDNNIPVDQIDLKTCLVVKTWPNPMSIERAFGFLRTNIIKCCRGKQISAYGFTWRYAGDQYIPPVKTERTCAKGVVIEVRDIDGKYIETLPTIKEVSLKYKLTPEKVCNMLNGRLSSRKCMLKYIPIPVSLF